jgi:hypothetical protein
MRDKSAGDRGLTAADTTYTLRRHAIPRSAIAHSAANSCRLAG